METFQKEITRKSFETMYRATDGSEFGSKDSCERYENTRDCAIRTMLSKFATRIGDSDSYHKFDWLITGGEEATYWIVQIVDEQKKQLLLAILPEMDSEWNNHTYWFSTKEIEVGKRYVLCDNYCSGGVSVYEMDKMIEELTETVTNMFGYKKNEEN